MKLYIQIMAVLCLLGVAFYGCKEDEPILEPKQPALNLKFSHSVDGSELLKNSSKYYTNEAGNKYMVSTFQYYISNIELTRVDDTKLKFPMYKLIDAFDTSTHTISIENIPKGDYKSISYCIGIDSMQNHSGSQTGDLSPTKGMLWTWASGYLFLKLEGFYLNPVSQESYRYHIGTDEFLNKVSHKNEFSMQSINKTAQLECNLAEFFKNPHTFDITQNNDVQSFPSERAITRQLATNMADMIRLIKIE